MTCPPVLASRTLPRMREVATSPSPGIGASTRSARDVLPLVTVTCADPGSCPKTVAVSTYCPGSIPDSRNVPDPSDDAIVL